MHCLYQGAMERQSQQTSKADARLPEVLTTAVAAALPAALQKASQAGLLPSSDQTEGQTPLQISSLSNESEQQLRLLVSEELARAAQQLSSAQVMSSLVYITLTPAEQDLANVCKTRRQWLHGIHA